MPESARARLQDRFGRVATDLRISVTDRCNFRCTYCMPPEGLPWLPRAELLTFEEIASLAGIFRDLGITSLKLTGGEPLVRRDLPKLVRMLRAVGPDFDISLTTNGYLLGDQAPALKDAGMDRVTVSCDSLLAHRFRDLTLRDVLAEVRRGLAVAGEVGLTPIKVNTVVMRGKNDDEVVDFARLARATGYHIRFIEYMPLDAQRRWSRDSVVSGAEIVDRINEVFPLERIDGQRSPAAPYRFADGSPGLVGIIPSVTEPFCESCDRLRITADGQLRACLFSLDEVDLRTPLRTGASVEELSTLMRACVADKWAGHRIGSPDFVQPRRSMSMIGG